jgi:potassium inwardly-rectifying channel subfamily J
MSFQSIVGVVIQACMAGIVFAKFTKPTHRGETIMFSRNALVSLRNGSLYLLVRIADLRPSHLIESHVSGHFLAKATTKEGEEVPYHLENMKFGSSIVDEDSDYMQLFWPLVVAHKIDSSSPLYSLSPMEMQNKHFEIILTLEGTTPETGNTIQVTDSWYIPFPMVGRVVFEFSPDRLYLPTSVV